MIELQGNIRVYCRVRPVNDTEVKSGEGSVVTSYPLPGTIALRNDTGVGTADFQRFEFDQVFGPDSTQEGVFTEVSPLVTSAMDGYNVCIFAYGQTGTGKTYTMEGPPESPGVNTNAFRRLFEVASERTEEMEYVFKCSMLEIYNETIMDLLELGLTDISRDKGEYVMRKYDSDRNATLDLEEVRAAQHRNPTVRGHHQSLCTTS